jgi:hypothetical protein
MKSHNVNSSSNFIGGWYIDEKLCDLIIQDFENRKPSWRESHSVRGYKVLNNKMMSSYLMNEYKIKIFQALGKYKELYTFSHETIEAFTVAEVWNIQKYEVGQHYSAWHCENNGDIKYRQRHLAFMTYLNDVSDGGETEFLYQSLKIRPEKGLTLIWPAYFTHTHCGHPSHTQEKYVTTGWFEFFNTVNFLEDQENANDQDFWLNLDKLHSNVA